MIEELLQAFAEYGPDAGIEEIADILWLAARVDASHARNTAEPAPAENVSNPDDPVPAGRTGPDTASAIRTPSEQLFHTRTDERDSTRRRGVPVRVAKAASLDAPLDMMRALRAIGRRSIGGVGERLDEQATVERSIEERIPSPVLLPSESRWLDLAFIVDAHHSMLLWTDLVDEIRKVLTHSGVFRDVRTWYLTGTESGGAPGVAHRRGTEPRSTSEITDPTGHRLVLIVTDTVADGWRGGDLHRVLNHWSQHNSVALLNILPERLWARAAVQPAPMAFRSDRPASPARSWRRSATRGSAARRRRNRPTTTTAPPAVPVISTAASSLARLARLLSGDDNWHRLAALHLETRPASVHRTQVSPDTARTTPALEAVERFRSEASPTAQQLAAYLAAVPLSLPVITLVRRSMLPGSEHGHLAEVALGGLFRPWSTVAPDVTPDDLTFDFLPGVRDVLLGSQLRADVATVRELVRRNVWDYLDRRRGAVSEFGAIRLGGTTDGRRAIAIPHDAQPFADGPELQSVPQPQAQLQGTHKPAAEVTAGPDSVALHDHLVSVAPLPHDRAGPSAGILLTPWLVLTCMSTAAEHALVSAGGRSVTGRVIWSDGPQPERAALILTQETVTTAPGPWTALDTAQSALTTGPAASEPVTIHAFSEAGSPVQLGGRALTGPRESLEVEITVPHPTTGWPQLRGAPLSRNGYLVGLINRAEPAGRFTGISVKRLLTDTSFRTALDRSKALGEAPPDQTINQPDVPMWPADATRMPVCLAIDTKLLKNPGTRDRAIVAERYIGDALIQRMAMAELDGTVTRGLAPPAPDVLMKLDGPRALWNAGRLLSQLPGILAGSETLPSLPVTVGIAMTTGEVIDAGTQGLTGHAVREAMAMLRDRGFRDRLARLAGADLPQATLTVSSSVRRQITDLLGRIWEPRFVAQGRAADVDTRGWLCTEDPMLLGREITEATRLDRPLDKSAPPWPLCGVGSTPQDPHGCLGRAVSGSSVCLAHLAVEQRTQYLATLTPMAEVDFSGTSFTPALLAQLLGALRDPETGTPLLGSAVFLRAMFRDGNFRSVDFTAASTFAGATFRGRTNFAKAGFHGDACFDRVAFDGPVRFDSSAFRSTMSMDRATLEDTLSIGGATFDDAATWDRTSFHGEVRFDACAFNSKVSFARAEFRRPARFTNSVFAGRVSYARATGHVTVSFAGSRFQDGADFSGFRAPDAGPLGNSVFHDALTVDAAPESAKTDAEAWTERVRQLVQGAEAVIFVFDPAVCRLFPHRRRAALADELLRLAAEWPARDEVAEEATGDPYAILAALSEDVPDSAVLDEAEAFLAEAELRAVGSALPTLYADPLLRTWRARRVRMAVLAQCSSDSVMRYLTERGLTDVFGPHIYSRTSGTAHPTSDPESLHNVMRSLSTPPDATLMIGSTPTELRTAERAGLRFLGYASNTEQAETLIDAGAQTVLTSLGLVLDLLRQ
ncbi:SAV_2336 N-terminal domain-related protein [Streptomyces sp. NPDC056580]|uniref:SAV_2336 N-terminal domain-related protein n=1 Tax=Streptomyces sp. NPDC056580 TaxID=3345872 RepID=UPI0036BAA4A1